MPESFGEVCVSRVWIPGRGRSASHRVIVVEGHTGRQSVTLQAHNGARMVSGTCEGAWENGLLYPKALMARTTMASNIEYLREKFGPLQGLNANDFRILDRLYREAVEELRKNQ